MNQLDTTQPNTSQPQRTPRRISAVALVGGVLLGSLDLLAQRSLPYPWANLANSSAVWAIGAFAIGVWVGARPRWAGLAGVLLLVVAVEAYNVAAVLTANNDLSTLWWPVTLMWMAFGVLAGAVFGVAGAWTRDRSARLAMVGLALPAAVLFAEAGVLVARSDNQDAAYRTDSLQTAAIETALGLLLLMVAGRSTRQRLGALAVSVPLALAGFAAFRLAGFGN